MDMEGTCKLCGKIKQLKKSHIIPNSVFKALYDRGNNVPQYYKLPTEPDDPVSRDQGGIWEHLLCQSCEQRLGVWEKYGIEVLRDGKGVSTQIISERAIKLNDIDYVNFKFFLLAILWKASIAQNPSFKEVELEEHENKLKKMILTDNPGAPLQYACAIFRNLDDNNNRVAELIVTPTYFELEGVPVLRFVMIGYTFLYFVSENTIPSSFLPVVLDGNGSLVIVDHNIFETNWMKSAVAMLKEQNKLG